MRDERRKPLAVGERVQVGGGYHMEPSWLAANESGYYGRVIELIPGQNEQPAVVVKLDDELVLPDGAGAVRDREVRGRFLVLDLRDVGADWGGARFTVHVEVCAERPPPRVWGDRPQGAWVESHAFCRRLGVSGPMPPVLPPIGDPSSWP
jgi:hypothetical protein